MRDLKKVHEEVIVRDEKTGERISEKPAFSKKEVQEVEDLINEMKDYLQKLDSKK